MQHPISAVFEMRNVYLSQVIPETYRDLIFRIFLASILLPFCLLKNDTRPTLSEFSKLKILQWTNFMLFENVDRLISRLGNVKRAGRVIWLEDLV